MQGNELIGKGAYRRTMPEDKSQSGFIHGSIWDSDALSRETRDVLELGLAGSSFTPHTPQLQAAGASARAPDDAPCTRCAMHGAALATSAPCGACAFCAAA